MDRNEFVRKADEKLKLIRTEYGFNQEKMADVLGISKKTLVRQSLCGRIFHGRLAGRKPLALRIFGIGDRQYADLLLESENHRGKPAEGFQAVREKIRRHIHRQALCLIIGISKAADKDKAHAALYHVQDYGGAGTG